jgi:ubiquitin-protein ligase
MTSPRVRRLAADWESVRGEFSGHPHVSVVPLGPGRPPEAYRVTLRVRGLRLDGDQPVPIDSHQVEIRLPVGYPREKPICTPITPVFHPNIKSYYCIQDYWAAGQPLVDTIAKLADMVQYRVYNPASPLDGTAARWARQNWSLFPIGNVSIIAPEVAITLGGGRSAVSPRAAADADEGPPLTVDSIPVLDSTKEPKPASEVQPKPTTHSLRRSEDEAETDDLALVVTLRPRTT